MPSTEIILLLAGKTGVGKSAVGNAILGDNLFKSTNSPDSVTKHISIKSRDRKDFCLTVVDTPGLIDTELGIDEAKVKACKDMKKAMQMCPRNGKLAVLFVIKYGERHTEDNKNTLHILENIFGKDNIWKSCIIVMTHGDNYDLDNENKLFYEYLKEQEGEFGKMFANCNYKCVLFHNKTKSKEQQEKELQMLINGVNCLEQGFTLNKFEAAYKEQNRLELEGNLPTLKSEFEIEIKRLNTILHEMKLTLESSDALDKLEYEILKNLDDTEKEDSPTKIYYKKGEQRFLENIRFSFAQMLELICKKRNELRQMKEAHDINYQIESIQKEINQTDPKQQEISNLLDRCAEKIRNKAKLIKKSDLRNEDKGRLKSTLDCTILEFDKLKMTAEKAEEAYLIERKENIITRLNNVSVDDTEANELLLRLRDEINTFILSLKNGQWLTKTSCVKDVLKLLKNIQSSIEEKKMRVRQHKFENSFNIQIENLMKEILEAKSKSEDYYKFICDIKTRLQNLKESLKTEQLNKDSRGRLKLSLENVNKNLETLKHKLQESQEKEMYNLLKSIMDRVQKTNYDNIEALNILMEARNNCKSLKYKLDQVKKIISEKCLLMTELDIKTIEKEIQIKEQEAKEWILTDTLISRIKFVTQEIDQIDIDDKSVSKAVSKVIADLMKLNKEIHEINVRELFMQRVRESIKFSENKLESIKQKRKKLFSSEIEQIRKQICQLDVNSKAHEEETNQIKGSLSQLELKMNKEDFDDDFKESFMANLNSIKLEIDVKNEDANQAIIAGHFIKEIQNLISEIGEYTIDRENLISMLSDLENKSNTLKSNINNSKLRDATKQNLLSSLEEAERKFFKRKTEIIEKVDSEIQWIFKNIAEANPFKVNISLVLSAMNERFEFLKTRIGDHFQEQYSNCDCMLEEFSSRVQLFNEITIKIDLKITAIKELVIPCKPTILQKLRDDLKVIEEIISDKVINSSDKQFFAQRIEQCFEGIETKASNNAKKIVGVAFRLVPVIGPFFEGFITAGVTESERKLTMHLS